MDRIDMLAEKIDAALRDDASGYAAFDMIPAWMDEYEAEHGQEPGTSGGSIPLDHYLHETMQGDFDDFHADGLGSGIARLGRVVYRWRDDGTYMATLCATTAEATATVEHESQLYDTGEE